MNPSITVFVNDKPVKIYRGMLVKHALIGCNEALFKAVEAGELRVVDGHGFQVGLDGALREGSRLFTRVKRVE